MLLATPAGVSLLRDDGHIALRGHLMLIRSYRRVFDIERRIYRVDRIRLNPGGVPVRGVIYFLAMLLAVLVLERLPLVSAIGGTLPLVSRGWWRYRRPAPPC